MPASTLLIVGSGPGIALSTALHFASKSFTGISLISRSPSNLTTTASTIATAHPSVTVTTHACNVADSVALSAALNDVTTALGGPPEVILFNAAHVAPSRIGDTNVEGLIEDFKITTAALYVVATRLVPGMLEEMGSSTSSSKPAKPTLLITGGHVHHTPFPPLFSLSVSKAAQYSLSDSLARVYGPKGLHVVTVVINGIVEGEEGEMSAKDIAGGLWDWYDGGAKGEDGTGKMSVSQVGRTEDFYRKVEGMFS